MKLALFIYAAFLAIEGGLAWLVSGNPFLLAAVTCGVLFYAALWKQGAAWGEVVRALTAGVIAVAGPLYYKASLLPTLLCFLALPHLLATTQCFWEVQMGKDPAQQNLRMRTVVFTVAFYAAMGLVFVLLRGADGLSPWITGPLAILVLMMAIPAWDLARITRLKPGRTPRSVPAGVKMRRVAFVVAILAALAAFFAGVLPVAAEKLCGISPRWKLKADAPAHRPPHENAPAPPPDNGPASRPGLDSSALTGRHELPRQSDIKATGESMLYLRPHDPAQAAQLARDEVYVRSHTLDDWNDGAWSPALRGGQWLNDAADGRTDGTITLSAPSAVSVEHTVFVMNADGYTLPALQNVSALRLPLVFALPGDVHQMQTAGDIRYDAVSAPLNWDSLPDRATLRPGQTGLSVHTKTPDSAAIMDLIHGKTALDPSRLTTLAQQVDAVKAWLSSQVKYSTVMQGDPDLTPLDNFLIGERKGYCDFYASAAALMLRFYGVPTRVAYGYAGGKFDERGGVFIFTDEAAHAWTEVFIEGLGWAICDFTPPQGIGQIPSPPQKPEPQFDEKQFAGQNEKPAEKPDKKEDEPATLASWWNDTMEKLSAMDPMERMKQTTLWLAAAAVLFFLYQWLRRRKKEKSSDGPDRFTEDERQPAYFAEFVRIFQEAGIQRPRGATAREYLAAVRRRGMAAGEFDPMLAYHYARRYTDAEHDRTREEEFLATVREVEQRLRQARQN